MPGCTTKTAQWTFDRHGRQPKYIPKRYNLHKTCPLKKFFLQNWHPWYKHK